MQPPHRARRSSHGQQGRRGDARGPQGREIGGAGVVCAIVATTQTITRNDTGQHWVEVYMSNPVHMACHGPDSENVT